ncbi:MAG: FAD:protein FMN transferase, partial [Bdellovibrionota bacterium]
DWQPGTQLSQVNQSAGARPVKVGADLYDLMKYTLRISEKTEGAFDPTFNAFFGLYKFKANDQREASDDEIRERLPLIDWRNVVMNDQEKSIFLKSSGMKLGLGGLGQGYGVDKVVADLRKKYPAGYVDGSGDTYFWGKKPDGTLWTTGIRDPRDKDKVALRVYGTDFSITTSGDDEKFFMKDGRRVHHIIDTKTGRPATASRQVTVIAKRALDADAFDTGAFVLGPEKGKKIVESVGLRAVFIPDKGVTMTKGLAKKSTPWGEVYEVEGELKSFE